MKKIILSLGIITALFSACKKDSADEAVPSIEPSGQKSGAGVTAVPLTFTKKAFIENFTGAPFNRCPESDAMINSIVNFYPGKVIAVSIHEADKMELPAVQNYHLRFNNSIMPSVPSFMVNRLPVGNKVLLNTMQLQSNVAKALNTGSKCGLAINSHIIGRTARIEVHAGFNQTLSGGHYLNVYLIENNVSQTGKGYDQLNVFNTVPLSPFFNMGDPIVGYVHQNVWRMTLCRDMGNQISPSKCVPGGHEIQNFQIDLPNHIDIKNTYVVAFVNYAGSNATSHEVLNAQIARLGFLKNWD